MIYPLPIIETIRESFTGSEEVYTKGSCYKFHEVLRAIFPEAAPYYDEESDHVVSKIGGIFYDINGVAAGDFRPLNDIKPSVITWEGER